MSYKRLDPEDVLISAESVTAPAWSGNTVQLTTFFTSSAQEASSSGDYYLDVYQTGSEQDNAEVQFSVLYGDYKGSGSLLYDSAVPGYSPTSVNYSTYKNLILEDKSATSKFKFGNEVESEKIYVININRGRYKQNMLPTTFELKLQGSEDAATFTRTLRNEIPSSLVFNDAGRVYNIISGSLTDLTDLTPSAAKTTYGNWGLFQPDIGVIVLNGNLLVQSRGTGGLNLDNSRGNNTDNNNQRTFFQAISGSEASSFRLSSDETLTSNFVFVRARNSEFNYSTNPSILTGSGELRYTYLVDNPRTYITTVGLYNDNNDLLAVAKLSRPLLKDSTREALIRVKLDY